MFIRKRRKSCKFTFTNAFTKIDGCNEFPKEFPKTPATRISKHLRQAMKKPELFFVKHKSLVSFVI